MDGYKVNSLRLISARPLIVALVSCLFLLIPAGGGLRGNGVMADRGDNGELTKESEEDGVRVKVTYTNPGDDSPNFNISIDADSEELDGYKFEELTFLRDDSGDEYDGRIVLTGGTGGHKEVSLEFEEAGTSPAKFIELVIEDFADIEEFVFRFNLKK